SLIALALMYFTVAFGNSAPLDAINTSLASLSNLSWVIILLVYSYVASILPVWMLLQPRDYINSLQLLSAMALVLAGLVVAGLVGVTHDGVTQSLEIAAPAVRAAPEGAPLLFPFLFITIACGAISGFHCLVSSGTSSKQIKCESDAQFVGYGSMLTEGFLAVIVILACVAGLGLGIDSISNPGTFLTGADAYADRYATWQSAAGLGAKVGAFVEGAANFVKALGLDPSFAIALMGVFVASFAATTLDTACRLQRYVTQELAATLKLRPLTNKHAATILAISVAFTIAAMPVGAAEWSWANGGKGGLNLWPLFGATNQLLAGLAFLVILFWMWRRNIPVWFIAIPASFMLVLPGTALGIEIFKTGGWLDKENYLLIGIAAVTLGLEIWIIIEALVAWPKAKGLIEPQLQPLGQTSQTSPDGGRSC
ncbi:MAG: carbon starvation CstA family protein, partial [Verrucomicrobiales bacterium]|nr:carbon starvation CstA family protein [Verrucomicrobiales bacterium]